MTGGKSKIEQFAEAWPEILLEIAQGKSLTKCCEARDIAVSNAHRWIMDKNHPERQVAYDLAYTVNGDTKADQIDDMAQMLIAEGKKMNSAEVQAYRTAIDALKWSAAIRNRKKYGDKQSIEIEQQLDPRSAEEQLKALMNELRPSLTVIEGKAA